MNKNDFEKYRQLYLDLGVNNNEIIFDYDTVTVPIIGPYAKHIKINFYPPYMCMKIESKHIGVASPNHFILKKKENISYYYKSPRNHSTVTININNIQDIFLHHKLNHKFIEYHSPIIKNKIIDYVSREIIYCSKYNWNLQINDANNFYELKGLLLLS